MVSGQAPSDPWREPSGRPKVPRAAGAQPLTPRAGVDWLCGAGGMKLPTGGARCTRWSRSRCCARAGLKRRARGRAPVEVRGEEHGPRHLAVCAAVQGCHAAGDSIGQAIDTLRVAARTLPVTLRAGAGTGVATTSVAVIAGPAEAVSLALVPDSLTTGGQTTLSGRVDDADGNPVAEATVELAADGTVFASVYAVFSILTGLLWRVALRCPHRLRATYALATSGADAAPQAPALDGKWRSA